MINLIAGIWLIVAPFLLGYSDLAAAMWNDVVVGIIVLGASAWAGRRSRYVPDPGHAGQTRTTVGERAGEE